jgi:hypothetical protein
MSDQEFNLSLESFQTIEVPDAGQVQSILIDFLNFLEEKCQNEKIDAILENIEDRIETDRFGVIPFLINFIKLKRQS